MILGGDIWVYSNVTLKTFPSKVFYKVKDKNSAGGKSYSGKPSVPGVLPNAGTGDTARLPRCWLAAIPRWHYI